MTVNKPGATELGYRRQADYLLTSDIEIARHRLSDWVGECEADAVRRLGFLWHTTLDAPSAYPDLLAAYKRSVLTGDPLPVSATDSASVIFTSPRTNFAWRFVHDVAHVERRLSFSLADEFELGMWHLSELKRAGFSPASLEYAFLKADTLGQVVINAVTHRFPLDQELFDLECQHYDFIHGVLREIRRESS